MTQPLAEQLEITTDILSHWENESDSSQQSIYQDSHTYPCSSLAAKILLIKGNFFFFFFSELPFSFANVANVAKPASTAGSGIVVICKPNANQLLGENVVCIR